MCNKQGEWAVRESSGGCHDLFMTERDILGISFFNARADSCWLVGRQQPQCVKMSYVEVDTESADKKYEIKFALAVIAMLYDDRASSDDHLIGVQRNNRE